MTIRCPFCDEDMVWEVKLDSEPPRRFKMCFECDSVWTSDQSVSDQCGSRFDTLMKTWGLPPDWNAVERIKMVEEPD